MNDGKLFEQVVHVIQQSLADHPETTISKNKKIRNVDGVLREFDVFVESKVNGMAINIAIECKDHKSRVSVGLLESFIGKCDRCPQIHKRVFVSRKGFQRDAVNAAKGKDISLYTLDALSPAAISDWLKVPMIVPVLLKPRILFVSLFVSPKGKPKVSPLNPVIGPNRRKGENLQSYLHQVISLALRKYEAYIPVVPGEEYQETISTGEEVYVITENAKYQITSVKVRYTIEAQEQDTRFLNDRYTVSDSGETVANAATAINDLGRLTIVRKSGEETMSAHLSLNAYKSTSSFEVKVEPATKER